MRGTKNERRASTRRQRRTSTSHDGDGSSRSRSAAELALEGRGGSSPRTRSCDGSSSARLLTEVVSVLAVRHSDDGSRTCVIDDDGSCSTQQHGDEDSAMQ
jgi:hypothetical protein